MGGRRIARERALQALYQLDVKGEGPSVQEALDAAWANGTEDPAEPVTPDIKQFAAALVEGVRSHLEEIDKELEKLSTNWRVDRMSRIDRNVLRLGAYELKFRPDVPKKVALNEAVELGKTFGTEDSSSFVNGLLDKLASSL